ncbi:MAG: hypothetical protein R2687_10005 [Candidatus Nanopelagicales bacterium]
MSPWVGSRIRRPLADQRPEIVEAGAGLVMRFSLHPRRDRVDRTSCGQQLAPEPDGPNKLVPAVILVRG